MKKLLLIFLLCTSCASVKNSSAFELLGQIGKKQLQKLTQAKDSVFLKDTLNLNCVVPREYCIKVLGKKVSKWLTKKGGASLDKQNLFASLNWQVQSDTTKVRIEYKRIRKPYANN